MITENGVSLAAGSDNENIYPDIIVLFQLTSASGGSIPPPPTSTTSMSTTLSTVTTQTSQPSPTGWNFRGCYTDSVAARALTGEAVPGGPTAMTIEACLTVFHGLGFILAGSEYADECCRSNFIPY
jgi:glucan 1,3-beta-glucosidase